MKRVILSSSVSAADKLVRSFVIKVTYNGDVDTYKHISGYLNVCGVTGNSRYRFEWYVHLRSTAVPHEPVEIIYDFYRDNRKRYRNKYYICPTKQAANKRLESIRKDVEQAASKGLLGSVGTSAYNRVTGPVEKLYNDLVFEIVEIPTDGWEEYIAVGEERERS